MTIFLVYGINFIISNKSKKRLTHHGTLSKNNRERVINPGVKMKERKLIYLQKGFCGLSLEMRMCCEMWKALNHG